MPRRLEDASTPRWLRIPSLLSRANLLWSLTRRSMALAAVVGGLITQFDVVVACKLQEMMLQPLCICSMLNSATCQHVWLSFAPWSFGLCGIGLDAYDIARLRLERCSNPRLGDVHGRWLWLSVMALSPWWLVVLAWLFRASDCTFMLDDVKNHRFPPLSVVEGTIHSRLHNT